MTSRADGFFSFASLSWGSAPGSEPFVESPDGVAYSDILLWNVEIKIIYLDFRINNDST